MPSSRAKKKTYPIIDSPLYRLKGRGQVEGLLGLTWDQLASLSSADDSYRVWTNERGREIQQPIGLLNEVQERLGSLLARVAIPDYVYSVRGRSYIDNARQHLGAVATIKTDIRRFYPSTTAEMIRKLFRYRFDCAADIAGLLTELSCYRGKHLPTGSAISGRLAALVAMPMFDEIQAIACATGCKFTVYVDDITLSGSNATPSLLVRVRSTIRSFGYRTSDKKSHAYGPTKTRIVTGVAVTDNELRLPNPMHFKIHQTRQLIERSDLKDATGLQIRLQGQLQSKRQIRRASEAAKYVDGEGTSR
jgi:hypothetical protein